MVRLSETLPPAVTRQDGEEREDLVRDLDALMEPGERYPTASASCTRPAILRRIAARAARSVGPGTDRLVADARDGLLAAAVSLHTGVPFALREGGRPIAGDLHPGERVVFVAYHLDAALVREQRSLVAELELQLGGGVAVFAEPGPDSESAASVLIGSLPSTEPGAA